LKKEESEKKPKGRDIQCTSGKGRGEKSAKRESKPPKAQVQRRPPSFQTGGSGVGPIRETWLVTDTGYGGARVGSGGKSAPRRSIIKIK